MSAEVVPGLSLFDLPLRGAGVQVPFDAVLSNATWAEENGYEAYWLAEGHFSDIASPSALALLAAVTQATETIRLGTAVIPLAFDNPLRVAETAAVVNALSGDRLELGVGKGNPGGFSATAYRAFGLDESDRETLYEHTLSQLRAAFEHTETNAGGQLYGFYPPAEGLPARIWQATGNTRTAAQAGRAGDGLQLHRFAVGGNTGHAQLPLVRSYEDNLADGARRRIGASRCVLPARDRAHARAIYESLPTRPPGVTGNSDVAAELKQFHILHGSADEIVEQLLADPTAVAASDVLFNTPYTIEDPRHREALAIIAHEIYPHLAAARSASALVPAG